MNTCIAGLNPARRISRSGFVLIELAFVVAIIGILAAMAIPPYQDYVYRARLAEGFTIASALQRSVADYYGHQGHLPADQQQAGLPPPDHWAGHYVERIELSNGALHITFSPTDLKALENQRTMTLRPLVLGDSPANSLSWVCGYAEPATGMRAMGENHTTIPQKLLPLTCWN
jgi:type IV pilus assembly protein PilA